jgi:hypothetical protein
LGPEVSAGKNAPNPSRHYFSELPANAANAAKFC